MIVKKLSNKPLKGQNTYLRNSNSSKTLEHKLNKLKKQDSLKSEIKVIVQYLI